jgi:hypothetical protein
VAQDSEKSVAPEDADLAEATMLRLDPPQCQRADFWEEPLQQAVETAVILRVEGKPEGVLLVRKNTSARFVLHKIPLP